MQIKSSYFRSSKIRSQFIFRNERKQFLPPFVLICAKNMKRVLHGFAHDVFKKIENGLEDVQCYEIKRVN